MKERSILFNGQMVRAILDGSKTQTRCTVPDKFFLCLDPEDSIEDQKIIIDGCRYGKPGDRLWVRETWAETTLHCLTSIRPTTKEVIYKAGNRVYSSKNSPSDFDLNKWPLSWSHEEPKDGKWKPSIHMRRKASRINLEITDVRVERIRDITPDDCEAEGIPFSGARKDAFCALWDSIYGTTGSKSWDINPWVWVLTFGRVE